MDKIKENSAEETLKKMKESIDTLKNRDLECWFSINSSINEIIYFYEEWEKTMKCKKKIIV